MNNEITREQIEKDLSALGLRAGDIVAVHSSMKQIGSLVKGGPEAVIQALINVLGDAGTLLMPVFNSPQGAIDLNTTPSRLGLITETFRCWPGVLRSNDPTHSIAALGRDAVKLLSGHEDVPPLGKQSPLHKAALAGGKTLHLGTDLKTCSLIHVAESIADAPYLHIGYPDYHEDHAYVGTDGIQRLKVKTEAPGDSSGFMKIHADPTIAATRQTGLVGNAASELYDSLPFLNAVVEIVRQDPFIVLCDKERCSVCVKRRLVKTAI